MKGTAKAPAVHEYVAQLVSGRRQGVNSELVTALFDKYQSVDLVAPSVNPHLGRLTIQL